MRKKPTKTMIGFEIPDQDKKRLVDLAAKNNRSVSAEMRIALARHIGKTSPKAAAATRRGVTRRDKMTTKQAAEIIKAHVNARDTKSASEGLNSTAYNLRRVGDAVSSAVEDIADDVLAGRGAGSAAASRRLIRVAKAVAARRKVAELLAE